jgi:hypothetical protein
LAAVGTVEPEVWREVGVHLGLVLAGQLLLADAHQLTDQFLATYSGNHFPSCNPCRSLLFDISVPGVPGLGQPNLLPQNRQQSASNEALQRNRLHRVASMPFAC